MDDPMLLADLGAQSPAPEPSSPGVSNSMFGAHEAATEGGLTTEGEETSKQVDALKEMGVVGAGIATGGAVPEEGEQGAANEEEEGAEKLEAATVDEGTEEAPAPSPRAASDADEASKSDAQDDDEEQEEQVNDTTAATRKRRDESEGAEGYEEEEEQQHKTSRPKKKSKRSRANSDSRSPAAERAEEEEAPLNDEDARALRRRQELDAQISAAAKMGKKRPQKKKGGADDIDLDMQADEEVSKIRAAMMEAAATDDEARERGQPATAKLNMLPIVMDTLQKSHLQQSILDNNLLEGVRRWLEPLPDKSLPNGIIQKALIPRLVDMDIDSITLKMSGLGKIMLFYSRCARVDQSLRRTADKLIENWSRPVLKRSSSYRDRTQLSKTFNSSGRMRSSQDVLDLDSAQSQGAKARKRNAAPPPPVLGRDFQYAPLATASAVMDERLLARQANHVKLNKFKRAIHEKKTR